MTKDKADKALRKVIINLTTNPVSAVPIASDDSVSIDISDRLEEGKRYSIVGIKVEEGDLGCNRGIIMEAAYNDFKKRVEDLLDATIVNAKQRESVQRLLNQAYWASRNYENLI